MGIDVYEAGTNALVASGPPPLDVSVSLAAYVDQLISLDLVAVDSVGQTTSTARSVRVIDGSCLTEVVSVDGTIVDWSADYIASLTSGYAVSVYDRANNQAFVSLGFQYWPLVYVAPLGALVHGPNALADIWELRNGAWINHGPAWSLDVAGAFAGWLLSSGEIVLYDIMSGVATTHPVHTEVCPWWCDPFTYNLSVSPFGDLPYVRMHIKKMGTQWTHLYHSCVRRHLSAEECTTGGTYFSDTDGVNAVFGSPMFVYALGTPGLIGDPLLGSSPWLHDGWIAFQRWDGQVAQHPWRRSPEGIEQQLGFWYTGSSIDALGDDGAVLIRHEGVRYLGAPPGLPIPVCTSLGTARQVAGQWGVAISNTLFDLEGIAGQAAVGTFCLAGSDCASSHCADGVCCDTGCNAGPCDACSIAGGAMTDGTCELLSGPSCNDVNACTQSDTCQAGVCIGGTPVVCAVLDQCHDIGVCNPASGVCSNPYKAGGCDDGDACTQTDTCQSGSCVGSNAVQCTALDPCHLAGTCDSLTGLCSTPLAMDGSPCAGGACSSGVCLPNGAGGGGAPEVGGSGGAPEIGGSGGAPEVGGSGGMPTSVGVGGSVEGSGGAFVDEGEQGGGAVQALSAPSPGCSFRSDADRASPRWWLVSLVVPPLIRRRRLRTGSR